MNKEIKENLELNSNEAKESTTGSTALNQISFNQKDNVIVVLGGEASGVSTLLFSISDHNIFIPPKLDVNLANKYPFNIVDSLNVGVSAGIIISHIKNQIMNNEVDKNTKETNKEKSTSSETVTNNKEIDSKITSSTLNFSKDINITNNDKLETTNQNIESIQKL